MGKSSGSEVTVRRIRADEWQALREIRLAALADAPFSFYRSLAEEEPLPEAHWRAWAERGAAGETDLLVVAERAGRLVGLVALHPHEGELELIAMWVAPDARGARVGARLVEAALEWAGSRSVTLWVTEDNPAHRIYERAGFRATGVVEPQRWRPERRVIHMRRAAPGMDRGAPHT